MTKWAWFRVTARRKTHVCAKSIRIATFSVTAEDITCPEQKRAASWIFDIVELPAILFYCVARGNDNGLSWDRPAPCQYSGSSYVSFCLRYLTALTCASYISYISCWTLYTFLEVHALMRFLVFGDGNGEAGVNVNVCVRCRWRPAERQKRRE